MSEAARTWGLRLLALAISIALWYSVSLSDRETLTETLVDQASVNYSLPKGYVLLDPEPVRFARVRLRGTEKKIRQLNPNLVKVQVPLQRAAEGEVTVSLGPEDVQVPDDFEVVSIEPSTLRVELDREVTQRIPVEAKLTGEPAAGARVREPEVLPNQVQVAGPASLVSKLDVLETRPVDLDGHAFTFEEEVSVLPPDDPLIQIVEPRRVLVRVPLELPEAKDEATPARPRRGTRGGGAS